MFRPHVPTGGTCPEVRSGPGLSMAPGPFLYQWNRVRNAYLTVGVGLGMNEIMRVKPSARAWHTVGAQ